VTTCDVVQARRQKIRFSFGFTQDPLHHLVTHPPCSHVQRQPRGRAITSEACIDSTEEEDSFTRPRRDTRGTTSTKVESSHDLMWSSCDLVALIH
jgi:hypothetical protein